MQIPGTRGWLVLAGLTVTLSGCPGPPDGNADASDSAAVRAETDARLQPLRPEEGSPTNDSSDQTSDGQTSDDRPVVVFMGTSLTEGLGLSDPRTQAWPARLAEVAAAEGIHFELRNAGVSGETSAGARRRVPWVMDRAPDLFVLETGANDGLRGLPISELEANLDAIFAEVRERAPGVRLALAGMEAPPNVGPEYVREFRAVFPRVAERWDATLIPFLLEGVAGDRSLNQADGIHPTAEGHRRMAREAWEVLRTDLVELAESAGSTARP